MDRFFGTAGYINHGWRRLTKQCRRVATRYDKLAANYLAFVQLASIRLWLAAR
jgi:transposase